MILNVIYLHNHLIIMSTDIYSFENNLSSRFFYDTGTPYYFDKERMEQRRRYLHDSPPFLTCYEEKRETACRFERFTNSYAKPTELISTNQACRFSKQLTEASYYKAADEKEVHNVETSDNGIHQRDQPSDWYEKCVWQNFAPFGFMKLLNSTEIDTGIVEQSCREHKSKAFSKQNYKDGLVYYDFNTGNRVYKHSPKQR